MPAVNYEKLKSIIKESVTEALEEELIKVRLLFFPDVSDREMLDISDQYGKPDGKAVRKETIDV